MPLAIISKSIQKDPINPDSKKVYEFGICLFLIGMSSIITVQAHQITGFDGPTFQRVEYNKHSIL